MTSIIHRRYVTLEEMLSLASQSSIPITAHSDALGTITASAIAVSFSRPVERIVMSEQVELEVEIPVTGSTTLDRVLIMHRPHDNRVLPLLRRNMTPDEIREAYADVHSIHHLSEAGDVTCVYTKT